MTFLFFTLPSNDLGLLAQSLPIARALRDRGHDVEFCTPARAADDAVVRAGFRNHVPRWAPYRMLSGDMRGGDVVRMLASRRALRDVRLLVRAIRHMERNATAEVWNLDHFLYVMGLGDEDYVRTALAALSDVVAAVDPDAVASFWNPLAGVAARLHGKPLISVMQAEAHPSSKGFLWWREPPAELPSPVGVVNRVLADHGLVPVSSMGELALGDLTLVPGIPELGPLPDDADVTYIGALQWGDDDGAAPAWLDTLPDDRPVVWIYPGNTAYRPGHHTPFDGRAVVEACVQALADLPLQAVLTTGRLPLPDDLGPLPANFLQADWAPGSAMARRSDLLIHHGGYGSCQAGLLAGTPAVVVPTYSERESNARRLAAAGAGEVVVPETGADGRKRVDPARLREAVERVLSEPSYRENARRIAEIMRRFPGAEGAAGLVEGVGGRAGVVQTGHMGNRTDRAHG